MSLPIKVLMDIVPVFAEWLLWVMKQEDVEFEEIAKAWPAPVKTRLAKIRYEAKLNEKFGGEP